METEMKIRLKKSCDSCRAFTGTGCDLGYSVNIDYTSKSYKQYSPAEWCEKPKTYSDFLHLRKLK